MSRPTCIHCGKTVSQGDLPACSTGCDLARRLPMGDKAMPASWELGGLMAWGFAVFNQLLFAAGDLRMMAREDWELASTFGLLSLVAGGLALAANGFFMWIARPKQWTDAMAILVVLASAAGVGHLTDGWLGEALVVGFSIFNLLLFIWLIRGLRFGRAVKKRQNGD